MDNLSHIDDFVDRKYLEEGYSSPNSDANSEASSSGVDSSSVLDENVSPSSSDSEASGAPTRDITKKLYKYLFKACKESDLDTVKMLIPEVDQLRLSLNATNLLNQSNYNDRYKKTPLLAAIEGGNLELVILLLDHGADPKRETMAPDSCDAINLAFRYGHTMIAEYLLDREYYSIDTTDNLFQFSLLHQAAYGHVECVRMLLSRGAQVNAISAFKVTPLHSAVSAGNPQVVEELIRHGASADAVDKFGRTALFLACNSFSLPIVKILVEEGDCDVNITDNNNNSAFDIADKKNMRETCRYLLQHGAVPKSIKENASGLGTLRFFRPYIYADQGQPELLPTARVKAGICSVGSKIYLNGGQGLKIVQNRPDEPVFKNPELLFDFFILDLKESKIDPIISTSYLQTMLAWTTDTKTTSETDFLKNISNDFLKNSSPSNKMAFLDPHTTPIVPSLPLIIQTSSSGHSLNISNMSTPKTSRMAEMNQTSPTSSLAGSQTSPRGPTPLTMSRIRKSDRIKVSKDGLTVTAMPQNYKSGLTKEFASAARGSMVSYQTEPHFVACVKSTDSYKRGVVPIAYWEMNVLEATEKILTIGFTHDDFPLNRYHPGWCMDSYAYHNDDGSCFHVKGAIPDNGQQWGPRFSTGDVIGAGLNYMTNEVFFTKNGKFLGVAYRGVTGDEFFATVSFGSVGCKVKLNFGRKPFKFSFLVPTLSWHRLGNTQYSPLALIPHPKSTCIFIQVSYGVNQEDFLAQRGDRLEPPIVSLIEASNNSLHEIQVHCSYKKNLHIENNAYNSDNDEGDDEHESDDENHSDIDSDDEEQQIQAIRRNRRNSRRRRRRRRTAGRVRGPHGAHLNNFHPNFNQEAQAAPLEEFLLPESDYRVHYDDQALYFFSAPDDGDVMLFKLQFEDLNSAGSTSAGPSSITKNVKASTELNTLSTVDMVWTDVMETLPVLRNQLSSLRHPGSALIDGTFYIFTESQLYIVDMKNYKWQTKQLTGMGPRGGNFASAVITQQKQTNPGQKGTNQILCFGGVVGNILQSNVHILELDSCEWDAPHLSGVYPRPRVDQGGLVYVGDDQHMVVIHGGWNGKNYIDDLDFLHLEDPEAPDPLVNAINNPTLSDLKILHPTALSPSDPTQIILPNKIILANKIILCARSTFFQEWCVRNPKASQFIISPSTDFELFAAFIKYLYTDTIELDLIDDTNASAFMDIFKKYAPRHSERVIEELVMTRPAIKSTMNADLTYAFNNELFSDIKFLVSHKPGDEPVKMYGHRAVLCPRNEYFGAMFMNTHFWEGQNGEASIKQVHPTVFSELIRYIYTFDIEIEKVQDQIIELLQVAHRYGVKGLTTLTAEIITSNLTVENVCSLLALGDQLSIRKIIKGAGNFVRNNLDQVSKTEDYQTHLTLINKILTSLFPQ